MEVMEEGNLMDRIPILLSRDMQYYQVSSIKSYEIENYLRINYSKIKLFFKKQSVRE